MTAPASLGGRAVDLVVVVNGFPRLSETFVLQELLDLERRGLRLHVVALTDPHEAVVQEDLARLRARVEHLPQAGQVHRRDLALAYAALVPRRGRKIVPALAAIAGSAEVSRGTFKRSLILARRIVQLGSPPLYIHFAHKPATIGRFAAALAGVRYALSCHAKDIWLTPPEELAPKLRDAEVVLTCTQEGRATLERHAGGVTPVKLVYHGVNVEAAVPRVPAASEPRVLSVGRLVEKKGYDNLIRAAERLRGRGVAFTLRIAGDGDQWPKLQRLVHELDLGRHVTFLGPLTPGELRSEWARASVFALACRRLPNGDRDGLPNVLLEAMVNGLPIVSTTQPGIVDAIQDGQNGLLVYPDNPDALADALERVLTQPRLAVELGEGAAASVRTRFDRRQLLPLVSDALAEAQLIPRRVSPRSEIEARVLEPAGA